mgnify:CR=1 FL=1
MDFDWDNRLICPISCDLKHGFHLKCRLMVIWDRFYQKWHDPRNYDGDNSTLFYRWGISELEIPCFFHIKIANK